MGAKKDALTTALDGVGKDTTVEVLKLEGKYLQKDRALKTCNVITAEIQKRVHILSTEEKMEMHALKDKLVMWVVEFNQQGRSDIDLAPVFKRVREMLMIWRQDEL